MAIFPVCGLLVINLPSALMNASQVCTCLPANGIAQSKKVFAYKMICKSIIEEKIMQLQERKKKLSDELIGEEDGFVKALEEEDIEFLFS